MRKSLVWLVLAVLLREGAGDRYGLYAAGEPAVVRAVAFALPAYGVHDSSVLEIDDWDHSH